MRQYHFIHADDVHTVAKTTNRYVAGASPLHDDSSVTADRTLIHVDILIANGKSNRKRGRAEVEP